MLFSFKNNHDNNHKAGIRNAILSGAFLLNEFPDILFLKNRTR